MKKALLFLLCISFSLISTTYGMEESSLKTFDFFVSTFDKEDTSSENVLQLLKAYHGVPVNERAEAYQIAQDHAIDLTEILGEKDPNIKEEISIEDAHFNLGKIVADLRAIELLRELGKRPMTSYTRYLSQSPKFSGLSLAELMNMRKALLSKQEELEKIVKPDKLPAYLGRPALG